jgi:hypothetical protein
MLSSSTPPATLPSRRAFETSSNRARKESHVVEIIKGARDQQPEQPQERWNRGYELHGDFGEKVGKPV